MKLACYLDRWPDPENLYPPAARLRSVDTQPQLSFRLQHIFHPPTFLDLANDARLSWPPPEKLDTVCYVTTELYCGLARNVPEMVANRKAVRRREMNEVVLPDCELSKERVIWELEPTQNEANWRGFIPRVKSVWSER